MPASFKHTPLKDAEKFASKKSVNNIFKFLEQ
jgi:hypothetical protein